MLFCLKWSTMVKIRNASSDIPDKKKSRIYKRFSSQFVWKLEIVLDNQNFELLITFFRNWVNHPLNRFLVICLKFWFGVFDIGTWPNIWYYVYAIKGTMEDKDGILKARYILVKVTFSIIVSPQTACQPRGDHMAIFVYEVLPWPRWFSGRGQDNRLICFCVFSSPPVPRVKMV